MPTVSPARSPAEAFDYKELKIHIDVVSKVGWLYMSSHPRPCFTPALLAELLDFLHVKVPAMGAGMPDFMVNASAVPGLYNLGGDLALFREKIENQDREGLRAYGKSCVEACYAAYAHPWHPAMTTIALVQGDALGGGLEAALACNVLVAERQAKMGFPEILFNLFPGMGALSFLGRKIGFSKAEKLILSGKLYSAAELYEMGVVDYLAEPGEGELVVLDYIRKATRSSNGITAARRAVQLAQPLSFDELMAIVEIWADAALALTAKDLLMMSRLVNRQTSKFS